MPKYSKGYLKLKKEIKAISDYNRGFHTNFWIGYVHGIHDFAQYGKITTKEGKKLDEIIFKGLKADQAG